MTRADPPSTTRRALVIGASALLGTAACTTEPPRGTAAPTGSATTTDGPSAATTAPATSSSTATPVAPSLVAPSIALTSGPDIMHGPAGRDEVALTFHGQGTRAVTDEVLAACTAVGAHITVFAVGTWIHDDPEQVRSVAAAGHEIGNHTWSHTQMKQVSAATARTEVARGRAAIASAGLAPGWWFRPSGTQNSTATIRAAALAGGYHRCVSYGVDPEDYLDPGATLVRSRTRKAVRPGSIVSLHLGHAGTAAALPGILSDLSAAGLVPVTLSTLLRD
ncbi:MAG: polysaccharide deacetylase family protein [Nostocoides sp.]